MPPAPTRHVIFHRPGPAWQPSLGVLDQPGILEHLQYLTAAFAAGRIHLAGPFLDDGAGGMVITSGSCTAEEARRLAAEDPAVMSGLIHAEVRLWMTTLAEAGAQGADR
jgi:uncharacterized protein YciI